MEYAEELQKLKTTFSDAALKQIDEMTDAIHRGIQNARENESKNSVDAFMDRNKRLLDKGREGIKRQQNKTYFS